MRIILHLDLDAFFASVEQRENPEYRGKPVIVGADPKGGAGRGVVSTCSYEAREFGIHSAMPISRAWKLCPEGIFVRPNFELYEKVSQNIMKIISKYSEKFEQVSIDEAFLDISNKFKNFDGVEKFAEEIKAEIKKKEKLTCSVGIGPNKLVAKLASDFKKPDGLTVVKTEDVKSFLFPLRARKLIGVGPKTERALSQMGIRTIGDIARTPAEDLMRRFGIWGLRMHQMANGIDDSEVGEEWVRRSVGREVTFEEDVDEPKIILKAIEELAKETHQDLIRLGFTFRTVTLKIRYSNFETHTHATSLKQNTNRVEAILDSAKKLIKPFLKKDKKIRLIGVRVSNLAEIKDQKTLA